MPDPLRILVVCGTVDDRASSGTLRRLVEELQGRPEVRIEVWFLEAGARDPWPGVRDVDSLRTWRPARVLAGLGLSRGAGVVRGRRLRTWFRALRPDVVVLDDGLGERLLSAAPGRPLVVVRRNPEPSPQAAREAVPLQHPDLVLASVPAAVAGTGLRDGTLTLPAHLVGADEARRARSAAPGLRTAARERWGIPADATVVVGGGDDGWVDGTDLFLRALWYLRDRHGIDAHGVWVGLPRDADEAVRLRAEAVRCRLGDRFHLVEPVDADDRWAGDVALLPCQVPAPGADLARAVAVGVDVVTFEPAELDAPWVRTAPLLDLEGLAARVAEALADGTDHLDLVLAPAWADRLVDAVSAARR